MLQYLCLSNLIMSVFLFCFFISLKRTNPRSSYGSSFAEFFSSIFFHQSYQALEKCRCFLESGTLLTALFSSLSSSSFFLYEKMFCILPKKTVLYTHVSKCTMFLSLCWFCFINRMLYFLPSMLIICFCFNIISNPTPTNFWIVKLNTRTLNSEFYWWHIWFFFFLPSLWQIMKVCDVIIFPHMDTRSSSGDYTLPSESDSRVLLTHSNSLFVLCTKNTEGLFSFKNLLYKYVNITSI